MKKTHAQRRQEQRASKTLAVLARPLQPPAPVEAAAPPATSSVLPTARPSMTDALIALLRDTRGAKPRFRPYPRTGDTS